MIAIIVYMLMVNKKYGIEGNDKFKVNGCFF